MNHSSEKTRDCAAVLPGFDHISRIWNSQEELCVSRILPGEYYVTRHDEIITTVLGSCVSACVRDLDSGVGGMNHFMLPGNTGKSMDTWGGKDCLATRYGIAAMENLINDILKQGAQKTRLEVKLFGGGKVMAMEINRVGERNAQFAQEFVRTEGLLSVAEDLGGPFPRKVNYYPKTGKVLVRRLRALQKKTIANQDRDYEASLRKKEIPGEIELFG